MQFEARCLLILGLLALSTALYVGAWMDMFGRIRTMGIFLAISFISNIFLTLNAIYVTWPKEYIFLCLIPQALESPMWIISLYSFIADISEPDQRPFRLAMIAISGLLGSPLGVPVGTIIFQAGNRLHSNGK